MSRWCSCVLSVFLRLHLAAVIGFQVCGKGLRIALHFEALSEANLVAQGKLRLVEERPVLAEERTAGLYEYGLHRHARLFCDQRETALEFIDGLLHGTRAFGK